MATLIELDIPAREPAPRPVAPTRSDPCADARPVCPACGGLECLCRPRFFPGQLLTDDDLNRLQRYVVDKNKLHNRYLHGWGVACGMEVVCDPCDASGVIVRSGYALGPCGDDIVVCKDQSVDVCDLIQTCRPPRDPVCDPPYDQPVRDCKSGVERWVLAVCYDERPSRGITAVTSAGDSKCGPACTCGGSGGCGKQANGGGPGACSGSETQKKAAVTGKSRKAYKPQCEPTQICEGYRFTAYPAPAKTALTYPGGIKTQPSASGSLVGVSGWLAFLFSSRAKFGPLIERVFCCVARALELRQQIVEGKNFDTAAAIDDYLAYAEALRDFAEDFGVHRCTFVGRVQQLFDGAKEYVEQVRAKAVQFNQAELKGRLDLVQMSFFDILAECFCSALLPACPEPVTSNCVPLAVVTVRRGTDCRVVEICNWEERKLLVTWRNVGYWLSWLPWNCLRDSIAKICCATDRQRQVPWLLVVMLLGALFRLDCRLLAKPARPSRPVAGARAEAEAEAEPAISGARLEMPGVYVTETGPKVEGDALRRAFDATDLLQYLTDEGENLLLGEAMDAPAWATIAANMLSGSALNAVAGTGGLAEMSKRLDRMQAQLDQLAKR